MRWRWIASGIAGVAIIAGVVWLTSGGELDRQGAANAIRSYHDQRSTTPATDVRCQRAGNVWRCFFEEGARSCMGSVSGDAGSPAVVYLCSEDAARMDFVALAVPSGAGATLSRNGQGFVTPVRARGG